MLYPYVACIIISKSCATDHAAGARDVSVQAEHYASNINEDRADDDEIVQVRR